MLGGKGPPTAAEGSLTAAEGRRGPAEGSPRGRRVVVTLVMAIATAMATAMKLWWPFGVLLRFLGTSGFQGAPAHIHDRWYTTKNL